MRTPSLMLLLLWILPALPARSQAAEMVAMEAVETSTPGVKRKDLEKTLDDMPGDGGWQVRQDARSLNSAVFHCQEPLSARRVRFSLWFQPGPQNSCFREFALSATTDTSPSLSGTWQMVFPVWFSSSEGELVRTGQHLRFVGRNAAPLFVIDGSLPFEKVTGLRIDVFPTDISDPSAKQAVLTQIRVERRNPSSSNVALGCPVKVSHPLEDALQPDFLTDGLPGTYARPPAPDLRDTFFFEIDLKRQFTLDHLRFLIRPDALEVNRFSRVKLELYEMPPGPDIKPVWQALHRADGSYPDLGQTELSEVIRAEAGTGTFRGRYLRISSDSPVPYTPQIAEVEAYPVLIPLGVSTKTEGQSLPAGSRIEIPLGSSWLTFTLKLPPEAAPAGLGTRWHIAGFHDNWQAGTSSGVVEGRCPPPGQYEFQTQIRHSDGVWNEAVLRIPMAIPIPFWQRPLARAAAVVLAVALGSLVAWRAARLRMAHRLAELEQRQELERERARIARDMHDVVGSRLTQLTVMHEIFAAEHPLPGDAGQKLQQLGETARAAITELDEAVWAVNPRNDTLSSLANYLCHTTTEYLAPLGIACRQDVPAEWPDVPVASHHRHELLLAFKEALQNVAKHSRATQVSITLSHAPPHFLVQLDDNGCGLPGNLTGMEKDGLKNMAARLAAIGGNCRVQSRPDGGTMVKMQVPLRHR